MWENTKDMIENFKVGYTFLFTWYPRHVRKSNRAKPNFTSLLLPNFLKL